MSDQVKVTSIAFSDDYINIQYIEMREQTKAIAVMRSVVIDTEFLNERLSRELESVIEDTEDFLDNVLAENGRIKPEEQEEE